MRHTKATAGASLRKALKARYPATCFRVFNRAGSSRCSVFWTDGPTVSQVRQTIQDQRLKLAVTYGRGYSAALLRKALKAVGSRYHVRGCTLKAYQAGKLVRLKVNKRRAWSPLNNVQQAVSRTLARLS